MQGKTGYKQPVHGGQHGCEDRTEEGGCALVPSGSGAANTRSSVLSGLQKPENEAGRGQECAEEQNGAVRSAEDSEEYDVRADLGDVLRHGIFSISAVSVVIFILALAGTVFSMVETVRNADLLGTAAGGAAGIAVAALIALSSLWDTVKDFVRYYDFRAKRREDKIHIQYGFFKKVEYTIPVDKIQALKIRQSMVARIGRRYMAEIINVGMGDDQEEKNSFLILYCAEDELRRQLRLLLPEYADTPDIRTERMPASVWAAWSIPFGIFAACTFAAAAAAAFMIPEKISVSCGPVRRLSLSLPFCACSSDTGRPEQVRTGGS